MFSIRTFCLLTLLVALLPFPLRSQVTDNVRHWTLDQPDNRRIPETVTGKSDTIEGYFTPVAGISGKAIRLDGFTSVIRQPAANYMAGKNGLTVEAWVALGAYPWNWCPVITQYREPEGGYSLEIGPRGELGLKQVIGGNLVGCISDQIIPLRTWTHVAATVEPGVGIRIYLNGEEAGYYATTARPTWTGNAETRIGMNYQAVYPANRIGIEGGDQPYWFSLDGIIDEVKVIGKPLSAGQIKSAIASVGTTPKPDLPHRQLPEITSTGKFRAYYEKLKYYDEWDNQWPIATDPDVVVTFPGTPVKMVFWRGTRYSPAWVTGNNLWMADQSVETWNNEEGCLEHMQDRHCKYSHVRIVENTDARVVVHWRYAPVSAYDKLRLVDEKAGWELWIDEYYYIYPDATAIRKVGWKTDHMCRPVQFQESLPLTSEGQLQGDVIEPDYLRIANLDGDRQQFDYVEDPSLSPKKTIPSKPNIQQHNFRSPHDPFIIFEPGNEMDYLTDRKLSTLKAPGSCNHWPVGQAYCDGSRVVAADRPTHFLGFPISDPVIHHGADGRSWLNSLYGMKEATLDELIVLGRSWATAPRLTVNSPAACRTTGYDMAQKAYGLILDKNADVDKIQVTLEATEGSPLNNPALVIENWGDRKARVTCDGKALREGSGFRQGLIEKLEGTTLVIWIAKETNRPCSVEISARR